MRAMTERRRTTIFIDLDDTLVDTFGLLITPLEQAAAEAICRTNQIPFTVEQLTEILLELRKRNPAGLRDELRELLNSDADWILWIRDQIFADFSIDRLKISKEVVAILKTLGSDYSLVLVTEGRAKTQQQKIHHLGIFELFDEILIIDPSNGATKESIIRDYMCSRDISAYEAVVVGNRLDREIIAGNRLGIPTIWFRSGEGSQMQRECVPVTPNANIDDFAELPTTIRRLVDRG
jgi:FMN phosphatase YigB (HAD superfamily)